MLTVIVILLAPVALGYAIGWVMRGRRDGRGIVEGEGRQSRQVQKIERQDRGRRERHVDGSEQPWLVRELDRAPFTNVLTPKQRLDLKVHYAFEVDRAEPQDLPEVHEVQAAGPATRAASLPPVPLLEPAGREPDLMPSRSNAKAPSLPRFRSTTKPAMAAAPATYSADSPLQESVPSARPFPSQPRREWDAAVLLLYLGAFLIVAAGIVYASYNWSSLGPVSKIGLLAAATIAFAGTGLALLSFARLRPAAVTFVAIGALLVPTNAIAAHTVLGGADSPPGLTVLLGSLIMMVLYGAFSFRPGGWAYTYGAVISGLLAVGALPSGLGGLHGSWGMILLTLAIAGSPALADRMTGDWHRFAKPLVYSSLTVLPFSTWAGASGVINGTIWFLPFSLGTAAVTTAVLACRSRSPIFSGLCSLLTICTVAGVLVATGRQVLDWSLVAVATAFLLILVAERGPSLARARNTRLLLHVEAVGLLLSAVGLADTTDHDWLLTFSLIAGLAGTALIAWLLHYRWILLLCSVFAVAAYASIATYPGDAATTPLGRTLFELPVPILLAVVAFRFDRKISDDHARTSWGVPVWSVAALTAIGITLIPAVSLKTTNGLLTAAMFSSIFAIVSLTAAWSVRTPIVRVAAGLWAVHAIGLLVAASSFGPIDKIVLALGGAILLAAASYGWAIREEQTRLSGPDLLKRMPDLAVFLVASIATLFGVLTVTLAYVVASNKGVVADYSIRWTWAIYLAIHVAIAALTGYAGYRRRHRVSGPVTAFFPHIALVFGLVAIVLGLRMATDDPLIWSWTGIGVAGVFIALSLAGDRSRPMTAFAGRMFAGLQAAGIVVGAIAVPVNLALAFSASRHVNDWVQAALYVAVGALLFVVGWVKGRPYSTYATFASFTLTIAFTGRGLESDRLETGLYILLLAWVIAGTGIILPTTGAWRGQPKIFQNSAYSLPIVTLLVAIDDGRRVRPDTGEWQLIVLTALTIAGMLAIEAWRRQDPARGAAASAIAMLALLMEIAVREPVNVQAYTVPLAIYLFGLGWAKRRQHKMRDMSLGVGAAVLIVPTFLQALNGDGFGWLLLAGGEALAFFVVGLVIRQRVLIGAGIIAISLIVLRMMVDAINAMPSWMILLVVGMILLVGGTVLIIWKEAIRKHLGDLQARWQALG